MGGFVESTSSSSSKQRANPGQERRKKPSMETRYFHELKKQTSSFMREKVRAARLALTNVTAAELLAEELTSGSQWPLPLDARAMGAISTASYEIDDYWRVARVLHRRLSRFDRNRWRETYYSLILLEHLLTHGPKSFSEEFQPETDVIEEAGEFHCVDDRGVDWGRAFRKKCDRVLALLEKESLLKEERDRARELTRRISRSSSSTGDEEKTGGPDGVAGGGGGGGVDAAESEEADQDHPFSPSLREESSVESLLSG